MPIDLGDYSRAIRASLKKGGFACVYVASVRGGKPCRIGYANELGSTIARLRRASSDALDVDGVMWVPDRGIATVVAQAVHCQFASDRIMGGWFAIHAAAALDEVKLAACRLYPGATCVTHTQLIGAWRKGSAANPS